MKYFLPTLFGKYLPVLILFTILGMHAQAQCTAPASVAHTSTNSTCASNGSITAGAATGGAGDYLEYALYNAANTTEVRPWQISTLFSDLASGSYTLRVRYVCGVGYSPVYTKAVTVGGSYVTPSITGITVQRRSQCNNGRISVTATGGTNPKTYALVSSLSAPEPIAPGDYVRVPQSSTIFDSLAAGTYYVRVYDACGSYATSSVTVSAFTQTNPFPNAGLRIGYWLCDSLTGQLVMNNLGDHVAGTTDTLKRLWITFPDGSTDTLAYPNIPGTLFRSFSLPLHKLGTVGAGHFPDNIGGTWPKTFQAGFKDACGNVFTYDYSFGKPNLAVSFNRITSSASNTCDSSAYRFTINSSVSPTSLINLHNINMNNNASYSIDGGATWQPVTTTAGESSQVILMDIGSSYNVCFAYCEDTTCFTGTVPALPVLTASAYEATRYACFGNSGFLFRATSGVAPVIVEMVSGPAGQAWITDSIYAISSPTYDWMTSSRNMLPGTYIFQFTDACGRIMYDTISTSYPYQPFDYNFTFPCGSTNMEISFVNDTYRNATSMGTIAGIVSGFKAQIYKADSTLASTSTFSSTYTTSKLTIPGTTISSLPNGNYFIRIWKEGADSCAYVDKPWEKTSSLISLSNSLAVSACPGTPTTGTVIGIAQGGSGGYSYSLYEGSVSASTLVAGPQPSGIFNGLDESATYIVTVSDTCGRGTQASMSFSSTPLPVYNNAGGEMPCPGDTLILSVNDMPEVSYQWYKNDSPLAGDTLPTYSVTNIEMADSGEYKVELSIGTCTVFLASFELDPSECGTPLPVSLLSFTAKTADKSIRLEWSTATEQACKGFSIERSTNGTNWTAIGFIASQSEAGYSNNRLDYAFSDHDPHPGVNYYRLKQLDLEGKGTYSETRKVYFSQNGQHLLFYPNPTQGGLNIEGLKGGETIRVYNAVGQLVYQQDAVHAKEYMDLSGLQNGMYQVQVISPSGNSTTHKMIKHQ